MRQLFKLKKHKMCCCSNYIESLEGIAEGCDARFMSYKPMVVLYDISSSISIKITIIQTRQKSLIDDLSLAQSK